MASSAFRDGMTISFKNFRIYQNKNIAEYPLKIPWFPSQNIWFFEKKIVF